VHRALREPPRLAGVTCRRDRIAAPG